MSQRKPYNTKQYNTKRGGYNFSKPPRPTTNGGENYKQRAENEAIGVILDKLRKRNPIGEDYIPNLREALREGIVYVLWNGTGSKLWVRGRQGRFDPAEKTFKASQEGDWIEVTNDNCGIISPEDVEKAALKTLSYGDPGFELVVKIKKDDGPDREFSIQYKRDPNSGNEKRWTPFFPPNIWNGKKEVFVAFKLSPDYFFSSIAFTAFKERVIPIKQQIGTKEPVDIESDASDASDASHEAEEKKEKDNMEEKKDDKIEKKDDEEVEKKADTDQEEAS